MQNTQQNESTKKKTNKFLIVILTATFIFSLLASAAAAACLFKLTELKDDSFETEEDVAAEDDVTIGGEYKILSTKSISDAYLSGDEKELSSFEKETLDMARKVLSEIISDGMSDFEKEQACYNWLKENTEIYSGGLVAVPSEKDTFDNPYCMLKYKKGVCVGYATTLRLFMQMLNIDSMVVHSSDLSHTWDLIKLDGEWYHTDVYADMEPQSKANLNMNDETASALHTWNTDFFPAATGIKYNPFYMAKAPLDDVYNIAKNIKDAIDNNERLLAYELSEGSFEAAAQICDLVAQRLSNSADYSDYALDTMVFNDLKNSSYVLGIYITSTSSDAPENTDPDYDYDRVNEILDSLFGPEQESDDYIDSESDPGDNAIIGGNEIINAKG